MSCLPAEVEDTIIDFLHADHSSLALCGLVCRQWLPASRYHLYSTILLTAHNAAAFTSILTSAPHLALVVQEVQIRFSDATLCELVPVIASLPKTTRLAFRPSKDEVSRTLTKSLLREALVDATRIKHLTFDYKSRFDSLRQVVDCICLCPQLASLELGGSWLRMGDFGSVSSDLGSGVQLPPNLRTLTLTCDLDYILNWLLKLDNCVPKIETLTLHHIVRREVPAIAAYLEKTGRSLKSLSLRFRDNDAPGRLVNAMNLACNPNLCHLTLEGTAPNILACLLNILPQIKDCPIHQLVLTLRHAVYYPDGMHILEEYPWPVLDKALISSRQLLILLLIVLDPLSRQVLPALETFILARLPNACKAGVIRY